MPKENSMGWERQKGPSGRGREDLVGGAGNTEERVMRKQGRELPQCCPNTQVEWLVLLRDSCGSSQE